MNKLDAFTKMRLLKSIETHRHQNGTFPTAQDLNEQGFTKSTLQTAEKLGIVVQVYVQMTNGATVKAYKQSSTADGKI